MQGVKSSWCEDEAGTRPNKARELWLRHSVKTRARACVLYDPSTPLRETVLHDLESVHL